MTNNTKTTYRANAILTQFVLNPRRAHLYHPTEPCIIEACDVEKTYFIEAHDVEEAKILLIGFRPEIKEFKEIISLEEHERRRREIIERWNKSMEEKAPKARELDMLYNEWAKNGKLTEEKKTRYFELIAELGF